MSDPHADLRAMLEALPADIQWEPQCGRIELRTPEGMSHAQMDDLMCWLLRAPALVRTLLAERDKLDKHVSETQDDGEWLDEVDAALGEDRKKAPFIDDAVRLLRKERDALKAEVVALGGVIRRGARVTALEVEQLTERAERAEAEVERLRAKPVTPEQLFSSSKVIWEGWVRARDEEAGCVLDLFNGRVDRSRYVRVVEADQPQKPVHHKWPADPVEPAKPAEPISDELRLRCELAGRLIPAWVVEGHFNNHNVTNVEVAKVAHNIADSLIAEARRRKEMGK